MISLPLAVVRAFIELRVASIWALVASIASLVFSILEATFSAASGAEAAQTDGPAPMARNVTSTAMIRDLIVVLAPFFYWPQLQLMPALMQNPSKLALASKALRAIDVSIVRHIAST